MTCVFNIIIISFRSGDKRRHSPNLTPRRMYNNTHTKCCLSHLMQGYHRIVSLPVRLWEDHYCLRYTHTHTSLTAICSGLPKWAGTRKVKPIWILLKQETVSGSGISWAMFKSAPRSRQIATPAPHHSFFYRPDALPATQPTASKHLLSKVTHP